MDLKEDLPTVELDSMNRRETLELVRAYYRIIDRSIAKKFLDLMKSISGYNE